MSEATCPKCNSHQFASTNRKNSEFIFIQCAECGCVISVLNIPHMNKRFNLIEERLNRQDSFISEILQKVRQLLIRN